MKKIIVSLIGLLFVITTSIVFSGSKMGMYATDPLNPPAGDVTLTVGDLILTNGNLDLTGVNSNRLLLPLLDNATVPTLAFGDGDTGFYETPDGTINLSIETNLRWIWDGNSFRSASSNAAEMNRAAGSSTSPSFTFGGDGNTGLGRAGADMLSEIAGGIEAMRHTTTSSIFINTQASAPGSCTIGAIYVDSTATASICFCNATNTWEKLNSAGAGCS